MSITESQLRKTVASKISWYRKLNGDTQADLALKLNYSDKSVSKWERGESMPDLFVLFSIAEAYSIPIDALITEQRYPVTQYKTGRRLMTLLLSVGMCWFVAMIVFCTLQLSDAAIPNTWMCFVYAITASAIVCVVFTCMWWNDLVQFISISVLSWSATTSLHLSIPLPNSYLVYTICAVFQVLVVLWFALRHYKKRSQASAIETPDAE